tara:strand:- start:1639 stop:1791 length:153 start_codon:yes stop_codon:yes gene_type:complete
MLENQEFHRKLTRAKDSLMVKVKRIKIHRLSLEVHQLQKAGSSVNLLLLI